MTKPDRAYLGVEGRDSSDGTERSAVEEEESRPGTTQQRSCGRRQERRWRRVVLVPCFTNAVQGVHLVGGDPQDAGFSRRARAGDGPGAKPLPAADYARTRDNGDKCFCWNNLT